MKLGKKNYNFNVLRSSSFWRIVIKFQQCGVTFRKQGLSIFILFYFYIMSSQVLICSCDLFSFYINVLELGTVKSKAYAKPQHLGSRRIFYIFIQDGLPCCTWGIVLLLGTTRKKTLPTRKVFYVCSIHRRRCISQKVLLKKHRTEASLIHWKKKSDHIENYFIIHLLIKPQEGILFIRHDGGTGINLLCYFN